MDIKRLLTSTLLAVALMLVFSYFFRGGAAGAAATAGPAAFPLYASIPENPAASEAGATPEPLTLGGADSADPDKLAITIDPATAGIDTVKLNVRDYAETVKGKLPLTLIQATPGLAKPFATLGIHITRAGETRELGYGLVQTVDKATGKTSTRELTNTDDAETFAKANASWVLDRKYLWKMTPGPETGTGKIRHDATLLLSLKYLDKPLVEITKTFHVDPASYEITITHTVKNLTDQPLDVAIDQLAEPSLYRDDPRSDDRFFHAAGLDSAKAAVLPDAFNLTQVELGKFTGGTRDLGQFDDFKNNPLLWTASSNRFFATFTRPLPETGAATTFPLAIKHDLPEVHHIASANLDLMLSAPKPADSLAIVRLTGKVLEIPANSSVSEPLAVYFGPKKREELKGSLGAPADSSQYTYAAYDYVSIIQYNRGCWLYSFCISDWVVNAILWLLDFLKGTIAFGNYGVAIMILVVLVRAALHPLTRASQINMAKMGKKMKEVQPKIESMKKKYADNKKKQSEEMMRIYRENNVNPAGGIMGCLPMLLQMPIWAALYSGLALDIDLRHASFIPGWINDLSNPDTVWPATPAVLGHPLFTVPILNFDIYGLNPLPLLLAVVLFFNMKVTMATQPKPADDQQAQMQKFSSYSIFILPFVLYNASSGSNLYFFASTMAGLVDTYLVRKSLRKQGILPATASALPTHEDEAKEE